MILKKNDDVILKYFGLLDVKMSNSNLEVSKANRANEISEVKDLTKYRLDEINKKKRLFQRRN